MKFPYNYKKVNYSKISQELFISIYETLKEIGFDEKIYFAKLDKDGNIHDTNKNYEYRLKLNKSYILPDFFIPMLKLIIEFDGTYYHRDNPENKKREKTRNRNIIDSGYKVIVSEWHPIIKYGVQHKFNKAEKYPCTISENGWGNLVAYKDEAFEKYFINEIKKRVAIIK